MLLWREILIRIMVLLQRNTLIERKNCTLKCLKRQYSTVRSVENVAVLTEDGICPLFFVPPRGIWQLKSPHPLEFTIQGQSGGGGGGGWVQLEYFSVNFGHGPGGSLWHSNKQQKNLPT